MLERIVVLVIVFTLVGLSDYSRFKQAPARERAAYIALLGGAAYMSIEFITNMELPTLGEAMKFFFAEPARRIVQSIKIYF